ncbi:MAG: hypothetical protein RJB39_545 [Candidatus Parcubacteria bacterium]
MYHIYEHVLTELYESKFPLNLLVLSRPWHDGASSGLDDHHYARCQRNHCLSPFAPEGCSKSSRNSQAIMTISDHDKAQPGPSTTRIRRFIFYIFSVPRNYCAPGRNRTYDPLLKRQVLYRLSYGRMKTIFVYNT